MLLAVNAAWADDPQQDLSSLTLEQLMNITVDAAALHPQTLRDAPASVTVITAEDIDKYGYRTLGEAMAFVRSFAVNYNRTYTTVGVRGFNLPWDYGSRILVMVNGHNMADHVFDSMLWFGDDFPIDMHLVKRIEIIRGPSSALYGSNGEFATINVVTKSPEEAGPASLTTQFGSFGKKKAQMMATVPMGKFAKILLSGTVFNNTGESPLYFPGLDAPETNHGQAINMDGEKGYHFFSNLTWRNWNVTAALSNRVKIQPVSWGTRFLTTAERMWMKPQTMWTRCTPASLPEGRCDGAHPTTRTTCTGASSIRLVPALRIIARTPIATGSRAS